MPRTRAVRLLYEVLWSARAAALLEAALFGTLGGRRALQSTTNVEQYFEGVCRFSAVLRRQDRQDVRRRVVELSERGGAGDDAAAAAVTDGLAEIVLKQLEIH